MKRRKGCWTCAARKVRCDGAAPSCWQCLRGNRRCEGYGARLSWPRQDDRKRVLVGQDVPSGSSHHCRRGAMPFFINTFWDDLERYNALQPGKSGLNAFPARSIIGPKVWNDQLRLGHVELLQYFYSSAYQSLVTFGDTAAPIRDALMRMALSQGSIPGQALLYAMLAFSSIHWTGINQQAMQLKVLALHCLYNSAKMDNLTSDEIARHVAASMTLGAFEMLQPSESSGEWLWHIWGAMDLIQAGGWAASFDDHTMKLLVGWAYYHETLSRFAVRHWRHNTLALKAKGRVHHALDGLHNLPLTRSRPIPPCPDPTYAVLSLLSETCETLLEPGDPRSRTPEYHDRITTLKQKTIHIPKRLLMNGSKDKEAVGTELYKIATRIYLLRASQEPWEQPEDLDWVMDEVANGPAVQCGTCEHFFPLFILSCEAEKEEHRVAILSLIDRTARNARIRSLQWMKRAIQSVWVQKDLHADSDLLVDYASVLSSAISSNDTIPSFV